MASSSAQVGQAITWAFDTFRRNPLPYLALAAVVAVLQMLMNLASAPMARVLTECSDAASPGQQAACQSALGSNLLFATFSFGLLLGLVFLAEVGVYRAALAASGGEPAAFSMLWRTDRLGRYIGTHLLMMLFTLLGLVACILPGLVLAFLMQLAPYYALDRGLRPMAAIRASIATVRANVAPALLMIVFVWLVTMVGSAFYGVLTLLTLPFAVLFVVHMYRQFNGDPIAQ